MVYVERGRGSACVRSGICPLSSLSSPPPPMSFAIRSLCSQLLLSTEELANFPVPRRRVVDGGFKTGIGGVEVGRGFIGTSSD